MDAKKAEAIKAEATGERSSKGEIALERQKYERKMRKLKPESSSGEEQVPVLDSGRAQEILENVFQACGWKKSRCSVEELERKGRYFRKERGNR